MKALLKKTILFLVTCVMLMSSFAVNAEVTGNTSEALKYNTRVLLKGKLDGYTTADGDKRVGILITHKTTGKIGFIDETSVDIKGEYKFIFDFTDDIEQYNINLTYAGENVNTTVETATVNEIISFDTSIVADDTSADITARIKNPLFLKENSDAIIAFYDAEGKLIDVTFYNVSINGSSNQTREINDVTIPENAKKIKAYCMKDITSLIPLGKASSADLKSYAYDMLFDENGNPKSADSGDLNILCIGGSLTAGDSSYDGDGEIANISKWPNKVAINYFKEKFPNKTLNLYNAGVGGTRSNFANYRFYDHVLSKNPDVVFIEFAVNDASVTGSENGQNTVRESMENLFVRLKKLSKQPIIISVITPSPWVTDQSKTNYDNSVAIHKEVADYHNVGYVDITPYLNSKMEETGNPLTYYYPDGNVHPLGTGYELFAEAIVSALNERPENYFKKFDTNIPLQYIEKIDDFKMIFQNDSRITYFGEWTEHNEEYTNTENPSLTIPASRFKYPWAYSGVRQSTKKGSGFEIKTTASKLAIMYLTSNQKNDTVEFEYYIDGVKAGSSTLTTLNSSMYYSATSNPINLPADGNEHTFKFVLTNDAPVFRFVNIAVCE